LIANTSDEEAFKRIVNYPRRGIGDTTINKLKVAAIEHEMPFLYAAQNPSACGLSISGATARRLQEFAQSIFMYAMQADQGMSVYELAKQIIFNEGIHKDLEGEGTEGTAKLQNLDELISAMAEMETEQREEQGIEKLTLTDYLAKVSLLTDADQKDGDEPRVTLMTVHAAKGLEFDAVFVTGMEEGLFPAESASFSHKEIEEERRLFYVAVTRAKKYCYLSYAKTRFKWGQFQYCTESSFLKNIPQRYFFGNTVSQPSQPSSFSSHAPITTNAPAKPSIMRPTPTMKPVSLVRTPDKQSSASSPSSASVPKSSMGVGFAIGDIVEHERFGLGKILTLEGSGNSTKAIVDFQGVGKKTLLLSFAKLKKVSG
jgi:DNA helicase-2/ATP-dependent DNA helicase PcrA